MGNRERDLWAGCWQDVQNLKSFAHLVNGPSMKPAAVIHGRMAGFAHIHDALVFSWQAMHLAVSRVWGGWIWKGAGAAPARLEEEKAADGRMVGSRRRHSGRRAHDRLTSDLPATKKVVTPEMETGLQ